MDTVENFENQATDTQDTATAPDTDTSLEALETDEQTTDLEVDQQDGETKPSDESLPFSNGGKEKFKVNGQEFEWDWEETRKYAQLGKAGQVAMQRASDVEKKARTFYGQLIEAAKTSPEDLIRSLTGDPNWRFHPTKSGQSLDQQDQDIDPREAKIQELEQRLSRFEKSDEQKAIDSERAAIAQEIAEVETKYPVLKGNKFAITHIKSEYKKALMNGSDLSIDDVAFYVAQELKESQQKQVQEKQKRIEQKRKNAPVSAAPGTPGGERKEMSIDDVKRIAGLL